MVELLVVIALVIVLLLILVPTLGRARMLAKMASCASNMRAVYIATCVYAGSNRGFIPAAGAYVRGGAVSHGTGHGWIGDYKTFFFGSLAKERAFDNPGILVCPGTEGYGSSDIHRSGLYARATGGAGYAFREMSEWYDHPAANPNVWCNYGLRWSGWWHKTYPSSRLMMAETLGCFEEPRFTEVQVHGGRFDGEAHNIGLSIGQIGEVSINILGSDGRIIRLMNYGDPKQWDMVPVEQSISVTSPEGDTFQMSWYYPTNDRSGDGFLIGWWGHGDPIYPDDPPYPHCMSDGPWAFWTNFDRKYFDGFLWPWGDDYWWPATWQNP